MKEWRGYWIPLWINPMVSAKEIAKAKRDSTAEYFNNFVAGLPYINVANMLSMQILESNLVDKVNSQDGRIIIGIDTGADINYVLTNKEGMFFHGRCKSVEENRRGENKPNYNPWDEIEALLKRFPRSVAVIDQGGDLIGPRILQEKYRGRVFLCWFIKEQRNQQLWKWAENDEEGKVVADRNRLIQLVVDEMKEKRCPIYGTKEEWMPFFEHALNIYRVKEVIGEEGDPQYGWRHVWKRKSDDHLFLAYCYARIGLDRFGQDLAQIIHKDSVMTGVERGVIMSTEEL